MVLRRYDDYIEIEDCYSLALLGNIVGCDVRSACLVEDTDGWFLAVYYNTPDEFDDALDAPLIFSLL